jgi:hypothetical protein
MNSIKYTTAHHGTFKRIGSEGIKQINLMVSMNDFHLPDFEATDESAFKIEWEGAESCLPR